MKSKMKRIVILAVALILAASLCACAGAGDWEIPLTEGYEIVRLNGCQISLVRDGKFIIDNFYVTSFQIHEPFVCVKGIKTLNQSATEEEIRARDTVCYLLNTKTEELEGPYENEEEFREYCAENGVIMDELWMPASYKVSEQFKEVS